MPSSVAWLTAVPSGQAPELRGLPNTIQKLTRELGEAVVQYSDNVLRNIKAQRVQCDEVWCFCYAKDKNLPDEMRGQPGVGSMWTWTALDADTKLMISWKLGDGTRPPPTPSCGTCKSGWPTACN